MNTKIIDPKCPYCKTEFTTGVFNNRWTQSLWGEYPAPSIKHNCPKCGETSQITVTEIYRYSAKKIKKT